MHHQRHLSLCLLVNHLSLFVCFVSFVVVSSQAQSIPPCINYQCRIASDQGLPINGVTNVSFSIYTNEAVGASVWGPQVFSNATVVSGYVNVVLSEDMHTNAVTSAFTNSSTWIEAVVGTTTNDRQQILSVPYAAQASAASRVNGVASVYEAEGAANGMGTVGEIVEVPGCWVEVATTGRPVLVLTNMEWFYHADDYATSIHLLREGVSIEEWGHTVNSHFHEGPVSFSVIDTPMAGTTVRYAIGIRPEQGAANRVVVTGARLQVLEL